MFRRLAEQHQAVNTTLCFMDRNDLCLSTFEVGILKDAVKLLQPFEEVTTEISADQHVSVSKVIPFARSLQHITSQSSSVKLELGASMRKRFVNIQGNWPLAAD